MLLSVEQLVTDLLASLEVPSSVQGPAQRNLVRKVGDRAVTTEGFERRQEAHDGFLGDILGIGMCTPEDLSDRAQHGTAELHDELTDRLGFPFAGAASKGPQRILRPLGTSRLRLRRGFAHEFEPRQAVPRLEKDDRTSASSLPVGVLHENGKFGHTKRTLSLWCGVLPEQTQMWRRYALIGCTAQSLMGWGCGDRGEVIARERSVETPTGGDSGAPSGGDTGTDGGQAGTSGGGAPTIQRPQFALPSPVVALNDPQAKDQDPSLTDDELEIFFFSDRGGDEDIWRATRSSLVADWNPPVSVPELNSDKLDQNPAISRDGLRIWFSSSREPPGIYFASRPSRDDAFGVPELIPIDTGNPDDFVIAPSVDVTELRMALSSGTGATRDLYEVVRPSLTGTWGAPALLSGANGTNAESSPYLIDDGREFLFISGRSGGGDLYWGYRESLALPAMQVEPLTELNDPVAFESHPHITSNRARVYFGSDRGGNTDIYVAETF